MKRAFESKGMKVNLGKTKLMVSGIDEEALTAKLILVAYVGKESWQIQYYVHYVVNGSMQDEQK